MGDAAGQNLVLAVGIAISPIPIIGIVLMLSTPRARSNGPAFMAGWLTGLSVVGAVVLLVSSGADASDSGSPADWVSLLKLVTGLAAAWLASVQWSARPPGGAEPEMPGWMQSVDRFTARKSATLGLALSAANPKNLLLMVPAAAAIAGTSASTGSQIASLAVFIAVATLGTATPLAIYVAMGDRSREPLGRMRSWLAQNNNVIMAVILVLIGAKLIGDAISGLAA